VAVPRAAPFLAAWAGPGLVFHAAYDWAPRFGVLLLAPAAILAAATVVPLLKKVGTARAVALLAAAVNVGVFLLPARLGPLELPEPFPSGSRLLARNADLARRDAAIRGAIDPQTSVVLAYDDTFHVVWFLPTIASSGCGERSSRRPTRGSRARTGTCSRSSRARRRSP
jgi:hypothetical protein